MTHVTLLALVVLGLAAARITRLITRDTIFERPRTWVRNLYPAAGDFVSKFERSRPRTLTRKWAKKNGKSDRIIRYRSQPTNHEGKATFYVSKSSWFGGLISCDWCTGVWVATVLTVFWHFAPGVAFFIAVPAAVAEIVGISASRGE